MTTSRIKKRKFELWDLIVDLKASFCAISDWKTVRSASQNKTHSKYTGWVESLSISKFLKKRHKKIKINLYTLVKDKPFPLHFSRLVDFVWSFESEPMFASQLPIFVSHRHCRFVCVRLDELYLRSRRTRPEIKHSWIL